MLQKTLVAGGCSFTDKNFRSIVSPEIDCSYHKWPELLGDLINYNIVNTGLSGSSNSEITKRVVEVCSKRKVDLVCVLWTGFDRFHAFGKNYVPFAEILADRVYNSKYSFRSDNVINFYCELLQGDGFKSSIDDSIYAIYILQEYLKFNNIPYIFFQGQTPILYNSMEKLYYNNVIDNDTYKNAAEYVLDIRNSKFFRLIDKKNFIGFPFDPIIGGFSFNSKYRGKDGQMYSLSEKDHHPNLDGHIKLAKIFNEKFYENIA